MERITRRKEQVMALEMLLRISCRAGFGRYAGGNSLDDRLEALCDRGIQLIGKSFPPAAIARITNKICSEEIKRDARLCGLSEAEASALAGG
jgi:hypothetical protein